MSQDTLNSQYHPVTASQAKIGIVLALFCLCYFLPTIGISYFGGNDEPRYTRVSMELLGRGNWFLLTLHGMPYDQKPPLPFWLMAGSIKLFGKGHLEFASRFPGVIAAMATVLITFFCAVKALGARLGWLSALMLLTTAQFLDGAPEAKLDMMFTAWTTASAAALWTRPEGRGLSWGRSIVVWGCLAAAFFTKGPLALLIIIGLIGGECWATRSWRPVFDSRMLIGFPAIIGMILVWLKLQAMAAGSLFVANQVQGETLNRFLKGDHGAPPWYYFPRIFISIAPVWTWFVFVFLAHWRREKKRPADAMDNDNNSDSTPLLNQRLKGGLIGWLAFPFLVLCLAHGKREGYTLPLMPPLAIMISWGVGAMVRLDAEINKTFKFLAGALILVGIITLIPILGGNAGIGALNKFAGLSTACRALLLASGLVLIALGIVAFRRPRAMTAWGAIHLAAAIILGISFFRLVAIKPIENTRKTPFFLSKAIEEEFENHPEVTPLVGGIGRGADANYHVYGNYAVKKFKPEELEESPLPEFPDRLLLCTNKDEEYVDTLLDQSFSAAWKLMVDDEEMTLFRRDNPQSSHAPKGPLS